MNRAYRIALICGALPLLLGVGIFLLWLATRRDALAIAGIYLIYLGLALFVVGLAALAVYGRKASRSREISRGKLLGNLATALVLLLANFPVAWGIIGGVVAIESRYLVVVHNESSRPLSQVRVSGGGASVAIFSIPPNDSTERSLWFQSDGELKFEAALEGRKLTQTIEGYVTHGGSGRADVFVGEDGEVTVAHPPIKNRVQVSEKKALR